MISRPFGFVGWIYCEKDSRTPKMFYDRVIHGQ